MPQLTDIELAGAGYMLLPAGYKREQAGTARLLSGRIATAGFLGGQRQPFQGAPDRGWDAPGGFSVYDGAGVEPWPNTLQYSDVTLGALGNDVPLTTLRCPSLVAGSRCYIGIGHRLWQSVLLTTGAWSDLTLAADCGAGNTITDLALYRANVVIMLGAAVAMRLLNTATGVVTNPWVTGEVGTVGVGYRGQVLYASGQAGDEMTINLSLQGVAAGPTVKFRQADGPIVRFGSFQGKAVIATRNSISLFGGEWDRGRAGTNPINATWAGDPEPLFTHGAWTAEDDFAFLQGHLGKLYSWLANGVVVYDPGVGSKGWQRTGPEGRSCYGACVSAGYLIVAIASRDGGPELWADDGDGWWQIERGTPGSSQFLWPVALGGAGNRDLLAMRQNDQVYNLFRLITRSTVLHTYRTTGEWRSSLLDAGEPAAIKTWTRLGATFAVPEGRGNTASSDTVTLTLDYSTDDGVTWITAAITNVTTAATRQYELTATLSGVTGRYLQVRATWNSVFD